MYIPDQIRYIQRACTKLGYKFELYDKHSGYLACVEHKTNKLLIGTGLICSYPLNSATSFSISVDKAHTYNNLLINGYNIPVGEYFFLSRKYNAVRGLGKNIYDAILYAQKIGFPVFVKPNDGSRGELAQIIFNENELIYHLMRISERHNICLIQEFISGYEYRIFILDGIPIFAYNRIKHVIIGDGILPIKSKLEKINSERIGKGLDVILEDNGLIQNSLSEKKLKITDILKKGEILEYTSSANISGGGEVGVIHDKFSSNVEKFCSKLALISNLRVCAIDLFSSKNEFEDILDDYKIIEINGNPSLSGLEHANRMDLIDKIWTDVLFKYFNGH